MHPAKAVPDSVNVHLAQPSPRSSICRILSRDGQPSFQVMPQIPSVPFKLAQPLVRQRTASLDSLDNLVEERVERVERLVRRLAWNRVLPGRRKCQRRLEQELGAVEVGCGLVHVLEKGQQARLDAVDQLVQVRLVHSGKASLDDGVQPGEKLSRRPATCRQ